MAALKSILSSRVSKWLRHTIATIFLRGSWGNALGNAQAAGTMHRTTHTWRVKVHQHAGLTGV